MTREEGKVVWAIALRCHGAEALEEIVLRNINAIYASSADLDLPAGVSTEGLAEIIRSLLEDIISGQRPLLERDRFMNRSHLQALLQLRPMLDKVLLADVPAYLLSPALRLQKAQIDFSI